MQMSNAKWWLGSAVVIGLLLYVFQHDFSRLRPPDVPFAGSIVPLPAPACSPVGGPCTVSLPQRSLGLELPADTRPLHPLELTAHLPDAALPHAGSASVEFVMIGMDMGLNRYTLVRQADGSYRARIILPVCSTGRSDWVAKVSVVVGDEMWTAEYPFTAEPSTRQDD